MPSIFASTSATCSAMDGSTSSSQAARPAWMSPPLERAITPRPCSSSYPSMCAGSIFACRAVVRIDLASGWLECCSPSAAACSRAAPSTPSAGLSRETANTPVVSVPVLSMMTVSISAAASSVRVCLIMMPTLAAAAKAATMAVGWEISRPPGQVTTSTVIARSEASARTVSSPLREAKNQTSAATMMTIQK